MRGDDQLLFILQHEKYYADHVRLAHLMMNIYDYAYSVGLLCIL